VETLRHRTSWEFGVRQGSQVAVLLLLPTAAFQAMPRVHQGPAQPKKNHCPPWGLQEVPTAPMGGISSAPSPPSHCSEVGEVERECWMLSWLNMDAHMADVNCMLQSMVMAAGTQKPTIHSAKTVSLHVIASMFFNPHMAFIGPSKA
jgi:hypothetical protein